MKKNRLLLTAIALTVSTVFFSSCEKDKKELPAKETYRLIGRIDPARTTITTAAITKAEFTVSYNTANSFGDAQSIINGNLALTGYTGITGRDTLAFFATQASGPAISFITVANSAINTTNTTVYYKYFNGSAATFDITNYPFRNEITTAFKEGRGFFRIGQAPKYVFILLDNVTKL